MLSDSVMTVSALVALVARTYVRSFTQQPWPKGVLAHTPLAF